MAEIVDRQYEAIGIIDALITSGDLNSTFATMDNDFKPPPSIPIIIVALNTTGTINYGSGDTGYEHFNLRLLIRQSEKTAGSIKLANEFVINALETIVKNLRANFGTIEHTNMNLIVKNIDCCGISVPMQLL